ncbi:acetyl-CoA C-acetyltransferase [Gammaproteobacteria bacterium]|nr:acetyl-CoA C-acetyltransferase [Gammaproteobacteria bacterium]
METKQFNRDVYIVDGARSPFLKARGKPGDFSAADLAVSVGSRLLSKQSFSPSDLDEVVLGCMMPSPEEANIARVVALRLGCGEQIPAYTVQRNCASGMQSIDDAFKDISSGRCNLVLAGGTEVMSRAPLLYNNKMVNWLAGLMSSKTFSDKAKQIIKFRPDFLAPVFSLLKGLTDFSVNLNMGQTAEIIAHRFGITREQMDLFSVESHKKVGVGYDEKHFSDIYPLYSTNGNCYEEDDGLRRDSSVEKLAKLKPFFDKKFGNVTAGNSSQITDGAALLLLASEEAVNKHNLPTIGKISNIAWAGLDPSEMGLGPVYASSKLLNNSNLKVDDIDFWEINEAFAAQVLACLAAFEDDGYCQKYLNLDKAIGKIDQSKLNVDGGAIALGHPVGASGARIVLRLMNILKRNDAKRGVASICIGGGQGGAMLIENISSVGV